MATLKIIYTIHENDVADVGVDADDYATRLEAALVAAYPSADVDVVVKYRTGGIGSGADVRYVDGGYEADDQADAEQIEHDVRTLAEHVFQQ